MSKTPIVLYAMAGQRISRLGAPVVWPAPGRVNPNTPIVWRPVTGVRVAD